MVPCVLAMYSENLDEETRNRNLDCIKRERERRGVGLSKSGKRKE